MSSVSIQIACGVLSLSIAAVGSAAITKLTTPASIPANTPTVTFAGVPNSFATTPRNFFPTYNESGVHFTGTPNMAGMPSSTYGGTTGQAIYLQNFIGTSIVIDFPYPVTKMGWTEWNGVGSLSQISLYSSSNSAQAIGSYSLGNDLPAQSWKFRGFESSVPFQRFVGLITTGVSSCVIDNVSFVPEPTTFLVTCAGMIGFVLIRRGRAD